jgi:ParB-like chromosome segregation protein Spo0J
MEHHPIANLFPMITGEAYKNLVEDIRENGLLEPIIVFEDKILDGRNRDLACKDANVVPKYTTIDTRLGPFDPYIFVVSKNINRRDLTTAQKAKVAASIATMKRGDNQYVSGNDLDTAQAVSTSQSDAAEMLGVSVDSVQRAAGIQENATKSLQKAFDDGFISISVAADASHLPGYLQDQIADKAVHGEKITRKFVRAIKDALNKVEKDKEEKREEEKVSSDTSFDTGGDTDTGSESVGKSVNELENIHKEVTESPFNKFNVAQIELWAFIHGLGSEQTIQQLRDNPERYTTEYIGVVANTLEDMAIELHKIAKSWRDIGELV